MTADERLALIRRKVERAKKHLRDLRTPRRGFFETQPYEIVSERDPQTGYDIFKVTNLRTPPPDIGLIAGDVIHNLRSALDHLAWQLVEIGCAASGTTLTKGERQQIGFPIWESATEYHAQRHRRVKGMAQGAIDAINATEPYKGGKGEILWAIHYLDIADKHHALLITLVSLSGILVWVPDWQRLGYRTRGFSAPNFGKPLKDGDVFFTCEPGVDKDTKFVFDVALTEPEIVEGKPLVELLKQTIDLVDNLIVSFKPLLT